MTTITVNDVNFKSYTTPSLTSSYVYSTTYYYFNQSLNHTIVNITSNSTVGLMVDANKTYAELYYNFGWIEELVLIG